VAEQTVEGVRNAKDGKVAGNGTLATLRTPRAEVAKRESRPHGRCLTPGGVRRARNGRTLKGSEAHERMNPFAQASGGRRTVKTASSDGNVEAKRVWGTNTTPPAERLQDSEEQPTPREAAPPVATPTGHRFGSQTFEGEHA